VREGSRRAILVAFLANLGVAIAKLVGYGVTGAASLLAEAVHSAADSGNQLLLFLGAVRAKRPATPEHPFGYAREGYFWAFMVAVVLFTLGSLFAISEGIEKLRHPEPIRSPLWAIGILLLAMVLEGLALRTAVRAARPLKGDRSWWGFIRHAKVAALPTILLEDLAALLGLSAALVCVSLSAWTGDPRFDALGSLLIGALLGVVAVVLGLEMQSLLIGEAATPAVEQRIRGRIESHPRVRRLIHMRTQHLGPDELLIAAKVELDESLSLTQAAGVIDEIESQIRAGQAESHIIYLEPDVYRPARATER
jgi:cation diffusion facilitator family transporter